MKKYNIVPILFSALTFILLLGLLTPTFLFVANHIENLPEKEESAPPDGTSQSPSPSAPNPSNSNSLPPSKTPSDPSVTPSKEPSLSPTPTPTPTPTPSDSGNEENRTPWILVAGEDAGSSYQDQLTFLGDSTTYGLLDRAILPGGQQSDQVWFGVNGHTITFKFHETIAVSNQYGAESGMTIKELAKKEKPEILVITLGVTGGVSYSMEEEPFVALYEKLIDNILEVSPNTKIICNTIYPVCAQLNDAYAKYIDNDKIRKTNVFIEKLAEERYKIGQSVYFLDSYSLLVGEDGYLPANMSNGDGLHLSDAALHKVVEILRTHKIPD